MRPDAKITCVKTGRTWKIHRDKTCAWSSHLLVELENSAETPPECKIDGFDDHEIDSMIEFMYRNGTGYESIEHRIDQDLELTAQLNDHQIYTLALWFHQLKIARLASVFEIRDLEKLAVAKFRYQTMEMWDSRVFFELVSQCSKDEYPSSVKRGMIKVVGMHAVAIQKMSGFTSDEFKNFMGGEVYEACVDSVKADANARIDARGSSASSFARAQRRAEPEPRFTAALPTRTREGVQTSQIPPPVASSQPAATSAAPSHRSRRPSVFNSGGSCAVPARFKDLDDRIVTRDGKMIIRPLGSQSKSKKKYF